MMSTPADGQQEGGSTRTFLVVSDLHIDWLDDSIGEDGDDVHYSTTVATQLSIYGQTYGCDTLLIGGDVGSTDDLETLYEQVKDDFETVKIARGNHDVRKQDVVDRPNTVPAEDYNRCIEETVGEETYLLQMQHEPEDFGLAFDTIESSKSEHEEPDVIVYGHSHMPFDRVLSDGTLAIGAGSTYENYNVEDYIPDTSFHILSFDLDSEREDVVVEHRDFETEELYEKAVYEWNQGFSEQESTWKWDTDNRLKERFIIPP